MAQCKRRFFRLFVAWQALAWFAIVLSLLTFCLIVNASISSFIIYENAITFEQKTERDHCWLTFQSLDVRCALNVCMGQSRPSAFARTYPMCLCYFLYLFNLVQLKSKSMKIRSNTDRKCVWKTAFPNRIIDLNIWIYMGVDNFFGQF